MLKLEYLISLHFPIQGPLLKLEYHLTSFEAATCFYTIDVYGEFICAKMSDSL